MLEHDDLPRDRTSIPVRARINPEEIAGLDRWRHAAPRGAAEASPPQEPAHEFRDHAALYQATVRPFAFQKMSWISRMASKSLLAASSFNSCFVVEQSLAAFQNVS